VAAFLPPARQNFSPCNGPAPTPPVAAASPSSTSSCDQRRAIRAVGHDTTHRGVLQRRADNTYGLLQPRPTSPAIAKPPTPAPTPRLPPPPANARRSSPPIPTQTIRARRALQLYAAATDPDVPAETLTWDVAARRATRRLDRSCLGPHQLADHCRRWAGRLSPSLLVVHGQRFAAASARHNRSTSVVTRVNTRPAITPPGTPISVDEQTTLSLPLSATDPDLAPANFDLATRPRRATGLSLNPATGLLTWTAHRSARPRHLRRPGHRPGQRHAQLVRLERAHHRRQRSEPPAGAGRDQ